MTGLEMVILLLFIIGLFAGGYFISWWFCNDIQLQKKEGHYILDDIEASAPPEKEQNLYTGLDMVDEAKNTYIKNNLDLDTINENVPNNNEVSLSESPEPPTAPSAPEETQSAHTEEEDMLEENDNDYLRLNSEGNFVSEKKSNLDDQDDL